MNKSLITRIENVNNFVNEYGTTKIYAIEMSEYIFYKLKEEIDKCSNELEFLKNIELYIKDNVEDDYMKVILMSKMGDR